jgi:hypothetical protein
MALMGWDSTNATSKIITLRTHWLAGFEPSTSGGGEAIINDSTLTSKNEPDKRIAHAAWKATVFELKATDPGAT